MSKYTLHYRTFDQLLAEVQGDFESYHLEDFIKPHTLIKIAKKVNYELGLKIHKTKDVVLTVEKGKAQLPMDFNVLNYMYALGSHSIVVPATQGTHVEEVPVNTVPVYDPGTNSINICASPIVTPLPSCQTCLEPDPCGCNTTTLPATGTWLNCKGEEMQLIQKVKLETRQWTEFYKVRLIDNPLFIDPNCPNVSWQAKNTAYIKDGYIFTTFKDGNLYLNYQGMMEDADGNLLVLDHPLINEYYEYAFKERIIENLLANQETVNAALIQRIDGKLRMARVNALSVARTPDFAELRTVFEANRKRMFNKYYSMFK